MTREYDDGYDSRDSFERADEDTGEQIEERDMTDIEMRETLIAMFSPRKQEVIMTDDDYMHAAWTMERMGGGFAARIAQAYYVADKDNKARLRAAFRELFERYHREETSK